MSEQAIQLIVGLGNPGPKYQDTRHNVGFWFVDRLAQRHAARLLNESKFHGLLGRARAGGRDLRLLQPLTYMNRSGRSVLAVARYFDIAPERILVVHDELDLPPGQVRLKQGGGHAGHNGLRSLHSHIGADYARVRLGIGHPGHKDRVAHYVLSDFAKADADWLDDLLRGISDGAPYLAAGDGAKFTNAVALRTVPPKPAAKDKTETRPAAPRPETTDTRSPLQKLVDKFR